MITWSLSYFSKAEYWIIIEFFEYDSDSHFIRLTDTKQNFSSKKNVIVDETYFLVSLRVIEELQTFKQVVH